MEFVAIEAGNEKICIYFDAKDRDYSSLKIFGLLLRYLKDVCEAGIVIAFYPNYVRCSFDCGQECHKIFQIVF